MKENAINYLKQQLQDAEYLVRCYKDYSESYKEGTAKFYKALEDVKRHEDERDIINYLLEVAK